MARTEKVMCDVCRDLVLDDGKEITPFVSYEISQQRPAVRFRQGHWRQVIRHICIPCFDGLVALHKDIHGQAN